MAASMKAAHGEVGEHEGYAWSVVDSAFEPIERGASDAGGA
jgi:hypothetical protein